MLQVSYIWPWKALRHIKVGAAALVSSTVQPLRCNVDIIIFMNICLVLLLFSTSHHIIHNTSSIKKFFHFNLSLQRKESSEMLTAYNDVKYWQYYYSVHLLSHSPPLHRQVICSVLSWTELCSFFLAPPVLERNCSAVQHLKIRVWKNMLCSSEDGSMPHRMTQSARNDLKQWKWDAASPSAVNSCTASISALKDTVRDYNFSTYSSAAHIMH